MPVARARARGSPCARAPRARGGRSGASPAGGPSTRTRPPAIAAARERVDRRLRVGLDRVVARRVAARAHARARRARSRARRRRRASPRAVSSRKARDTSGAAHELELDVARRARAPRAGSPDTYWLERRASMRARAAGEPAARDAHAAGSRRGPRISTRAPSARSASASSSIGRSRMRARAVDRGRPGRERGGGGEEARGGAGGARVDRARRARGKRPAQPSTRQRVAVDARSRRRARAGPRASPRCRRSRACRRAGSRPARARRRPARGWRCSASRARARCAASGPARRIAHLDLARRAALRRQATKLTAAGPR